MRNRLTVSDVMTPDVITVPEDTPYKALVALMAKHHISALPVLNQYGGVRRSGLGDGSAPQGRVPALQAASAVVRVVHLVGGEDVGEPVARCCLHDRAPSFAVVRVRKS